MIVVDLPEGWDELAASFAAQSIVLHAARKVADAATAVTIADNARKMVIKATRAQDRDGVFYYADTYLKYAKVEAKIEFDAAVREYRKLMEGENDNR